jgi:integrase
VPQEVSGGLLVEGQGAGAQLKGQALVIEPGAINVRNIWRDFGVICKRAGIERYAKPLHALRKSAITDWAAAHPMHVVRAWAGHGSITTTDAYYLKVSDADYEQASGLAAPLEASEGATGQKTGTNSA